MSDKKLTRNALGRGLSAIMSDVAQGADMSAGEARQVSILPVDMLDPNPNQPRRDFGTEALEELALSIKEKGVVQPLIVRAIAGSGRYEIVAGERRWRAAQKAGLHQVPVVVRDFTDEEVLEIAIIENVQRADLNAVEEALAYKQLIERFGHTQEKIAQSLSRSRSHIANALRLLALPEAVQAMLRNGALSAGHARALITHPDPEKAANDVVRRGLSVRETEKLGKAVSVTKRTGRHRGIAEKDADTKAIELDLSANLGMRVDIAHRGPDEGGSLTLHYRSLDDLDMLCDVLSKIPRDILSK